MQISNRKCTFLAFLLLLPLALRGGGPERVGSDSWLSLSSPHFTLATDAGEMAGREALDRLERLRSLVGIPAGSLEIVLFHSLDSFRALYPKEHAAGFFQTGLGHRHLVATDLRSLAHEYVHAAVEGKEYPLWAQEGLASFYAASRFESKGIWIGVSDPASLSVLRSRTLIPMAEMAAADHTSRYYQENDDREMFYAQTWALVHLLFMSDRQIRADFPDLPRQLEEYVKKGPLAASRFIAWPAASLELQVRPLSDPERRFLLLELAEASPANVEELAKAYPEFIPAKESLAENAFATSDFDNALSGFEQAITLGSARAQTFYLAGLVRLHYTRDPEGAERLLARAATLDPGNGSYLSAWDWARDSVQRQRESELLKRALVVSARAPDSSPWTAPAPPRIVAATIRPRQPAPSHWLVGTLTWVDCQGTTARLDVLQGKQTMRLLIRDPYRIRMSQPQRFTCGPQMKPIRVAYKPVRDRAFQTEGDVVALAP